MHVKFFSRLVCAKKMLEKTNKADHIRNTRHIISRSHQQTDNGRFQNSFQPLPCQKRAQNLCSATTAAFSFDESYAPGTCRCAGRTTLQPPLPSSSSFWPSWSPSQIDMLWPGLVWFGALGF